jgi:hypothetical protein
MVELCKASRIGNDWGIACLNIARDAKDERVEEAYKMNRHLDVYLDRVVESMETRD